MSAETVPSPESRPSRPDSLAIAARIVVLVACGWWLLGEFAAVLRPLLIAVFLCYVLLPTYSRLRRRNVPTALAVILLAGSACGALLVLALFVYGNVLSLAEEGPALQSQAVKLAGRVHDMLGATLPDWLAREADGGGKRPEEFLAAKVPGLLQSAVNVALGGLIEAAVAGLYLLFLLLGAERLPGRVRRAYDPERAERILAVAGRINSAIISYLKAKCLSSLLFAVPVWLALTFFGVKFAVLWAVLTFICNFIPYVGSVVAYALPVAFATLQFAGAPAAAGVAVVLLLVHLACAMLVEPMLIGRAVGLSPLVVLAALAVWGLVWGLPGMVLAVPLTVVAKIVLEHIEMTRPFAKLVEE
jgi:AI-2 transport protein TqsA